MWYLWETAAGRSRTGSTTAINPFVQPTAVGRHTCPTTRTNNCNASKPYDVANALSKHRISNSKLGAYGESSLHWGLSVVGHTDDPGCAYHLILLAFWTE
jgi:hypothetical protein